MGKVCKRGQLPLTPNPKNFYRVLSFLLLVAEEEETHKTAADEAREAEDDNAP